MQTPSVDMTPLQAMITAARTLRAELVPATCRNSMRRCMHATARYAVADASAKR